MILRSDSRKKQLKARSEEHGGGFAISYFDLVAIALDSILRVQPQLSFLQQIFGFELKIIKFTRFFAYFFTVEH